MSSILSLMQTEELEQRLRGDFRLTGPWPGRDLRVQSGKIKLGGSASAAGISGLFGGDDVGVSPPKASYQWLFFDTLDGSLPAGEQEFEIFGPSIPFVGAITEIDVKKQSGAGAWQMLVGVEGVGPVFQTTQPDEILPGAGFWRPIPVEFWPETEGLVFPLAAAGLRPRLVFRRPDGVQPNLVIQVMIVAHPNF